MKTQNKKLRKVNENDVELEKVISSDLSKSRNNKKKYKIRSGSQIKLIKVKVPVYGRAARAAAWA
jgi:hypothetical protein